jgi:general secretion pathway protein A
MLAGAQYSIFSPAAIEAIYNATGGVPRLVNQLCDFAMVYAFTKDQHRIQQLTVQQVLDDGVFFAGGVMVDTPPTFSTVQTGKRE